MLIATPPLAAPGAETSLGDLSAGVLPLLLLILPSQQDGSDCRQSLTLEGFDIAWETDFERGLEQVGVLGPSLVVLDLSGASSTGFESLLKLRRQSTVPVLVVTDTSDSATRIDALESGADGCISKPCDPMS